MKRVGGFYEPVLDRWRVDDTFACRICRGREAAVDRATQV